MRYRRMAFAHPTNLAEGEYYRRLGGFNDALTGYQGGGEETWLDGRQRHALWFGTSAERDGVGYRLKRFPACYFMLK